MQELTIIQNNDIKSKVEGIIKFYNIDSNLFNKKLAERLMFTKLDSIRDKEQYLLAIIRAMIKDEKLENTAKEKSYGISSIDIANEMRYYGIKVYPEDVLSIEIYLKYVKNKLNNESIKNWVEISISYVLNNKATSKEFISLFKRTKTMKELNLDYKAIEEECRQEEEKYNNLVASIYK